MSLLLHSCKLAPFACGYAHCVTMHGTLLDILAGHPCCCALLDILAGHPCVRLVRLKNSKCELVDGLPTLVPFSNNFKHNFHSLSRDRFLSRQMTGAWHRVEAMVIYLAVGLDSGCSLATSVHNNSAHAVHATVFPPSQLPLACSEALP